MQSLSALMLSVARTYCAATGVALSTASRRAFDESKLLDGLADGRTSPTLARADRALTWFSANWPENADWPDGVPRPALAESAPVPHEAA